MLRIPGLLLACVLPLAVLLLGRAVPATADDDYSITIIQSNREGTGGFSWDLTSDVDGIIVDSTPFPTLTLEQGAVVRFVGVVEDSHSFEVQANNVEGVERATRKAHTTRWQREGSAPTEAKIRMYCAHQHK